MSKQRAVLENFVVYAGIATMIVVGILISVYVQVVISPEFLTTWLRVPEYANSLADYGKLIASLGLMGALYIALPFWLAYLGLMMVVGMFQAVIDADVSQSLIKKARGIDWKSSFRDLLASASSLLKRPGGKVVAALALLIVLPAVAANTSLPFPGRYTIKTGARMMPMKVDNWTGATWTFDGESWRRIYHKKQAE